MTVVLAFVAGAVSSAAGVFLTLLTLHPPGPVAEPRGPTGEMRAPPPSAPPAAARPPLGDVPATTSDPSAASHPRGSPTVAEIRARREVRTAVFQWIEAQRRADLAAQMRFYPRTVPVFYRWRDVDRSAVRAEKARVFGGAPLTEETLMGSFVEGARVRAGALAELAERVGPAALGGEVRALLVECPLPLAGDGLAGVPALRDAYAAHERAVVAIAARLDELAGG